MLREEKFKVYYTEFLRYVRPPEPSTHLLGAVLMTCLKEVFLYREKTSTFTLGLCSDF